MILPKEKMNNDFKRSSILSSIINIISKEPLSIADISRKFSLNRSTTRYYLGLLKQENIIILERQEKLPGRPTFVKINNKTVEKQLEEMEKMAKEYRLRMSNDPITKEILIFLSNRKRASTEEILKYIEAKKIEDMYVSRTLSSLQWLKLNKKIVDEWSIV